jgi:hypothetical protein
MLNKVYTIIVFKILNFILIWDWLLHCNTFWDDLLSMLTLNHECTVVGNPGGGRVLGVLAKFCLGGYLGLSENLGGLLFSPFFVFYCTCMWQFFIPYPPPLCASMHWIAIQKLPYEITRFVLKNQSILRILRVDFIFYKTKFHLF